MPCDHNQAGLRKKVSDNEFDLTPSILSRCCYIPPLPPPPCELWLVELESSGKILISSVIVFSPVAAKDRLPQQLPEQTAQVVSGVSETQLAGAAEGWIRSEPLRFALYRNSLCSLPRLLPWCILYPTPRKSTTSFTSDLRRKVRLITDKAELPLLSYVHQSGAHNELNFFFLSLLILGNT